MAVCSCVLAVLYVRLDLLLLPVPKVLIKHLIARLERAVNIEDARRARREQDHRRDGALHLRNGTVRVDVGRE